MIIELISVGEPKTEHFREAEQVYLNRIRHYCPIERRWIKAEKVIPGNLKTLFKTEGQRLLRAVTPGSVIVCLDRCGVEWDSETLAKKLQKWQNGSKRVSMLIGGAFGLGPSVLDQSQVILSLSKMTYPHELVPVILLEQIYRAFTICRGEKYHK